MNRTASSADESTSRKVTPRRIALIVVAIVLPTLGFIWWSWARSFTSSIVRFVESQGFGWILVGLMLACAGWAWRAFYKADSYSGSSKERNVGQGIVAIFAFVAVLGGAIFYDFTNDYATAKADYYSSIQFLDSDLPNYEARAPYPQAAGLLVNNRGKCTGTINYATYVIDGGDARWTAVVDGEEMTRPIGCVVTWDGEGRAKEHFEVCEFAGRTRAIDGWFGNNLNRLVQHSLPRGSWFNPEDTYGTCENGKAVLYVPVLQNSGFVRTHPMPGGLLVVRSNEDVTLHTEVAVGEFPGPVYPTSLAREQEKANRAHAGWSEYRSGVNGFEVAGDASEDDPNAGNDGQFLLRNLETMRGEYVSPLATVGGNGKEIVAASAVESDHVTAGELNPARIYRFDSSRASNTVSAQNIQTAYGDILSWANADLRVMEITPGADGIWYGTIGKSLALEYRVHLAADGSSTVYDFYTGEVVASADANGNTSRSGGQPSGAPVPEGASVADLSVEELQALRAQVDAALDSHLAVSAEVPAE